MAKKEATGNKPEKAEKAEKSAKDRGQVVAKEAHMNGDSPEKRLAELKKTRQCCSTFLFLPLFLVFCAWIILFSTPCKVKKRVDCGWSGISSAMCRSGACLVKEPEQEKVLLNIKRTPGAKSGVKLEKKKGGGHHVTTIKGVAAEHNEQFPDQALSIGDRVSKVNGASGDKMQAALNDAKLDTIKMEIMRPRNTTLASKYPAFLRRIDSPVVTALMSPAFERWLKISVPLGGVGFFLWFASGYPIASLPVYYLLTSGVVGWHLTGCCYNDSPKKQGDPHCFQAAADKDLQEILMEAYKHTTLKKLQSFVKL